MTSRSRRLVLLAVVVGAAAALVPVPSLSLPRGVEIQTERLDVVRTAAAAVGGATRAHGARTGVDTFRLIGLSWSGADGQSARIRVHDSSGWSPWTTLDADGGEGPDHASSEFHPGTHTDPYWAGKADGYQVDVPGDAQDVHV